MRHRGPDSEGLRDLDFAVLGMRRLRIIDLTPDGDQPMTNEDGSVWAVMNGEIYNFVDLRNELSASGHVFRSKTDTEVLLHLWEEVGPRLVDHLRGMYALAVADVRQRRVFLARDRLGIKPLYYTENGDRLAFASELKALVAADLAPREIDFDALDDYLTFGCVPAPRTMLRGVRALPPAHAIDIADGRMNVYRYWDLPAEGSVQSVPSEVVPRVRELLEDSIRRQCQSDVPLGAFLSGGIDSSAVVGLMSQVTGRTPRTFNVSFVGAPTRFNEATHARLVAERFGTDHTEVVLDGATVRDELEKIVWYLDQPSADGINSYFVSRAASDGGLVVALSGLGGDELFGGYGTYRLVPRLAPLARAWGVVPAAVREAAGRGLHGVAAARPTGGRWHKVERLPDVDSALSLYAVARTLLWPPERASLWREEARARANGRHDPAALLGQYVEPHESLLRMVTRLEMRNYMAHRLLRDTDAMSMAHSLEVRVPLIDDELVSFVTGVGHRPKGREPKPLLVAALGNLLPAAIVERPKHGFEFPMDHWMRHELRPVVEDALSPATVAARGLFDPNAVRALYRRFLAGNQEYQAVWQLVVFELWTRAYIDRGAAG